MDGSTVAIILLLGGFMTIACAATFIWATAPRLEERPDDYMLGYEAYIRDSVRPDRLPTAPPRADSELGLAAQQGRRALFHSDEGEAGLAAPAAVLGHHRGRFRFVK